MSKPAKVTLGTWSAGDGEIFAFALDFATLPLGVEYILRAVRAKREIKIRPAFEGADGNPRVTGATMPGLLALAFGNATDAEVMLFDAALTMRAHLRLPGTRVPR